MSQMSVGGGGGALVTEVLARISADSSQFVRGMQDAAQAAQQFSSTVEQSTGKAESSISKMGSTAANVFGLMAGAFATAAIGFGFSAFNAAARVGELDVALRAIAKSTGQSYDKLNKAALAVKGMGIEMAIAQQSVMKFVQMNLDASKAADVARVAQDLAVIAGENSTDTLARLTQAIQTQNSESLRNVGIMKTSGEMFNDYAKTLGISAKEMTTAQKQQAILNGVLKEGAKVAGTYEAAMTEPGKVLRSFPRLVNDLAVAVGMPLKNAFGPLILNIYEAFKAFKSLFEEGGALKPTLDALGAAMTYMVAPLTALAEKAKLFFENIKTYKGNLGELADKIAAVVPLVAALTAGFAAMAGTNLLSRLPLIGSMFAGIAGPMITVAAVLAALAMTSPALQSALIDLVSAFAPLLPIVQDLMNVLGQGLYVAIQLVAAAVEFLARGIAIVTGWMAEHKALVENLLIVLGVAVAAYWAVAAAAAAWAAAQSLLNMTLELNPIGLVVAAIAALVAAFVIAWQTSETFRNVMTVVFDTIAKVVGWALAFVINAIGQLLLAYGRLINANSLLGQAIAFVFNFIWKAVTGVVGGVITAFASLVLALVQLIQSHKFLYDAIALVMKGIVVVVTGAVSLALNALAAFIQGLGNLVRVALQGVSMLASGVARVLSLIPGMGGIVSAIAAAGASLDAFGAQVSGTMNGAANSVRSLASQVSKLGSSFDAGGALDKILAGVKAAATAMKSIGSSIQKAGSFELGTWIVDNFGKAATASGNFLVGLANTIRNYTSSGFTEKVATAVGGLVDKLKDAIGLNDQKKPSDILEEWKKKFEEWQKFAPTIDSANAGASDAAKKIAKQADIMKAIRDAMARGIEQIQKVVDDLKKAAQDFAKSLKDALLQFAGLKGIDLPDNFVPQFESLLENMRTRLQKALDFTKMVTDLKAMGLNETTLKDILDMGALKGSQYAQSLLQGGAAGIKEINALQEMIVGTGDLLGQFGANAVYADDIAKAQEALNKIANGELNVNQSGSQVFIQEGAFKATINISGATTNEEIIAMIEKQLEVQFGQLATAIAAGK